MTHRSSPMGVMGVIVLAVVLALAVLSSPTPSSAIFTSSSSASGQIAAAADWTPPTVSVTSPGAWVKGVVTVEVAAADTEGPVDRVVLERQVAGSSSWVTVCTDTTAPFSCAWDTRGLASGQYALRARATDRAGLETTSAVVTVTVDNVAPSVTLADPGSPLSGTRTFSTTATDAHTGVKRVVVQASAAGSSTWTDLCSTTAAPWTCQVATGTLSDGVYAFRAVATDGAGHTATSAVVTNRLIENTGPAVALTTAPATLRGTVQVGATATSLPGVVSVTFQHQRNGTSTWTDICTDTSAPYACAWDTMGLANGNYSLRAVMVDTLGRTTISSVVTNRVVDNRPFTGVDVQTFNGPRSTSGRPDSGDTVVFTLSHQIDPATVMPGWDGSSRSVTVRLRDDAPTIFVGSKEDTLEVLAADGSPTNFGKVNLMGDYIRAIRTADFDSTMVATTVTAPDGTVRTVVTVTMGTLQFGGLTAIQNTNHADPGNMVWTPSALLKDIHGRPISSAPVTETGPLDREF